MHRHRLIALIALLLTAGMPPLNAQPPKPREQDVKAVYLLNFGKFVRWPATRVPAAEVFTVCVLGRDPFGQALEDHLAGETVDGKAIVAQRLNALGDADGCRIVFVAASESRRIRQIVQHFAGAPTLTVSDLPQFTDEGGMIQFVADGKRIRFAVNVAATESAGLTLSSELLRVAILIKPGKAPPL